ncbi:prolipoprotein diacylglyceryl transferase [Blastococcus sp. DSM 46786]|uniref:prolipoprotein diacylglyceryl transferase n=1 Tax=Blastococcus sp. DSM 46786 TaxID=1798227 RepID=UPI0008ACABE3|nr:prolipoprotein diacylglyceryl transferase [Blastococcus sp. DSM 46786]SEM01663.1 prolipoprotein diacylglyceryl transferase [Blastococcus sp. DSM 46786]
MTALAAIPSPTQGVWELGPFPIRAYALAIIAGIALAVWITDRRWQARGGAPGDVADIAVWAVPFGILGGRLYHVISSPGPYFGEGGDPLRAFAIWEGGLGIWGAVALGGVGAWIACRRRGIPLPAFADAVAPGLLVAQAIGRLGNWFNNELYGARTDLPWALTIYEWAGGAAVVGPDGQPEVLGTFHPTFLYELLWNLVAAALVVWADRRFQLSHGRAFALYVASYSAGRLWIELLRIDPATTFFGIRLNVFTAFILGLLAVAYLIWQRGRPREVIDRGRDTGGTTPSVAHPGGSAAAQVQGGAEPAAQSRTVPTPGAEGAEPAQDDHS